MTACETLDRTAYNKYEPFPQYSYECIKYLRDNNQLIWKLLKYNTPDAWENSKPNLSPEEKGDLIWAGKGDSSDYRIFADDGVPDVETKEITRLSIYPYGISPDNRTVGSVSIMMEVYSHFKINTLSNYETRVDRIIQQLLYTFNGVKVPNLGIGRIFFAKPGLGATRLESSGQLPFRGKWLLFGSKTA